MELLDYTQLVLLKQKDDATYASQIEATQMQTEYQNSLSQLNSQVNSLRQKAEELTEKANSLKSGIREHRIYIGGEGSLSPGNVVTRGFFGLALIYPDISGGVTQEVWDSLHYDPADGHFVVTDASYSDLQLIVLEMDITPDYDDVPLPYVVMLDYSSYNVGLNSMLEYLHRGLGGTIGT